MSAQVLQSTFSVWKFWFAWMLATAIGAAIGLFLSFPLNEILVAVIDANKTPPWTATETALIMAFKGAEGGMMGLGMGLGQWWLIRKHLNQMSGWIIATGLALFLQSAFRWSLPYNMPPQQVGVSVTISFGIFLGVCQWFVLRKHVAHSELWIAINMVGWLPALALMFAPDLGQILGMVLLAIATIMPFAIAGAGMVWLLRPAHQ